MSLDMPNVSVPKDQSRNEWVAYHVFEFLKYMKDIQAIIQDTCTCPTMKCGGFEFMWSDGKATQSLSALEYFNKVESLIYKLSADESMFPIDNTKYQRDFIKKVSTIYRRMFRTFVHAYLQHQDYLKDQGLELVCLSKMKHFYYFCKEYDLCKKEDFSIIQGIIDKI
ncbi:Mob1-like protein [Spironucleus salmonicida]|nr:Mob1-like protein [Spironucleus salmonicida]